MNLEEHAEELASDLGVDKEEVKRDLENLVEYSVPVEEAKGNLRRKYGGDGGGSDAAPPSKDIADITTGDSNVSVTGVVLTVGKRSIRYQGEDQVIYEGQLADDTGRIDFTSWVEFDHEPGDTLSLGNAGVREWEGNPELNIGQETAVEAADRMEVDYTVGGDADLAELSPGDRGVNVEVTPVEVERKVIDGRDGETEILSGVLADETARLPFTDWDPHPELEEGASVRAENVYIREFRGAPSVNVSEFSTVEALDRTVHPRDSAPRVTIGEAVDSGGLFDVEVTGNVVGVRDGSGLIERCPECGRVTQNGQCRQHGAVEGEDDLRTKCIFDDGTGTLTVVLDEEITEEVYGGDLDDAREHARDAMDRGVVADDVRAKLVGREFRARGSLSVDDFGATLDATEFAETDDDPAARAEALLAEVDQ